MKYLSFLLAACVAIGSGSDAIAQGSGTVTGTVTLEATGEPVHGAVVLLIGLGRFTTTDGGGRFILNGVPKGTYQLLVEREHLTAERQDVTVDDEETVERSVVLALSPIHESVTVTTSARGESTALDQFNAVTTLDSFDLAKDMWGTLGEAVQNEAGVAKRSFGPGPSRPIIRGFDGDRVLIMNDGTRTGDLSSQSGDHNVSVDPANLERIEIIRGPSTLLYGSNAVGGVVNTISPQDSFRRSQPQGVRGQAVFDGGTANNQLGGNANLRYGNGNWMIWGGGGTRRTEDYDTPEGTVENSKTELSNGSLGAGFYGERAFFAIGYGIEDGRFGVPGAGEFHGHEEEEVVHDEIEGEHEEGEEEFFIDNDFRRQNVRFDFGLQNFNNTVLDSAKVVFQRVDWNHDEVEIDAGIESVGTQFTNDIYLLRAEFEQSRTSDLTGRFGIWYKNRDYNAIGAEALSPRTTLTAFAGFAYEELALGPATTLSFGGRVEHNDYNPEMRQEGEGQEEVVEGEGHGHEEKPTPAIPRSFTSLSGAVGLRYDFTRTTAFVGNFTSSYRPPALEELYNFGPHVGNLAFEVGDSSLEHERINGIDLGVKGRASGIDANFNFFYYDIKDSIFWSFEEEILDGLRLAEITQGDARYVGFDAQASFRVAEFMWLKAGFGLVDAKLTKLDENLPRVPPFHGRVEVEMPFNALTVTPELIWSAKQGKVFSVGESPTDGYAVVNVRAQYTLARTHQAHIFAVKAYNLTNELYRTHTNFIKEFAPEIGRGIKFTYSLRFF